MASEHIDSVTTWKSKSPSWKNKIMGFVLCGYASTPARRSSVQGKENKKARGQTTNEAVAAYLKKKDSKKYGSLTLQQIVDGEEGVGDQGNALLEEARKIRERNKLNRQAAQNNGVDNGASENKNVTSGGPQSGNKSEKGNFDNESRKTNSEGKNSGKVEADSAGKIRNKRPTRTFEIESEDESDVEMDNFNGPRHSSNSGDSEAEYQAFLNSIEN